MTIIRKTGSGPLMKAFVGMGEMEMPEVLRTLGLAFTASDWIRREVQDPATPRWPDLEPGPWYDEYVVAVRSVTELREILPLLSLEGSTSALYLYVLGIQPTFEGWSQASSIAGYSWKPVNGAKGSAPGLLVTWTSSSPAKVHSLLVKLATPQNRATPLPLRGLRLGVATRKDALWAAGDPLARWLGGTDSILASEPVNSVDVGIASNGAVVANDHIAQGWTDRQDATAILPPVDTALMSPCGFLAAPTAGTARLTAMPKNGSWTLTSHHGTSITRFDDLDENILALLRQFESVEIDHGNITETNFRVARVISQLAVAGVPMLLANLASEMSELLGTELMAELQSLGNRTFHSDLERESFSINCRRAGLRGFSPAKRWINTFSTPLVTDESVSIILATRRPQLLPRILQQIENQSATEIEVIIGLHGHTEPDTEVVRMLEKFRFEAKLILFSEECSLGSVLNGLTRAAGGRFISKMDDDDWYAPHHIEDLLLGKSYSGAGLVGAPVEFTYIESADLTTQRGFEKECFTEHVAGGTILLSKELLQEVGGWRATRSAVDRGLIDAVLASGERVYRIHGQNYLMHRRSPVPGVMAHTWSAGDEVFLRNCINQWDGFVPPPQFEGSASWFEPPGRLPSYQSYFDMASTRTKGEPRALRHLLRDEK